MVNRPRDVARWMRTLLVVVTMVAIAFVAPGMIVAETTSDCLNARINQRTTRSLGS